MKTRWLPACCSLFLLLALAVGCVTNGKEFKSETSWIKKDVTTKDNVKNLLGQPYSVGNSGGKETWTYGYYRYKLIGKSSQKELKFYWNANGKVDDFSFNSSFPSDTGQGQAPITEPVGP